MTSEVIERLRELSTVLMDAEKRIQQAAQALKSGNNIVAATNLEIAVKVCQRVKKELAEIYE